MPPWLASPDVQARSGGAAARPVPAAAGERRNAGKQAAALGSAAQLPQAHVIWALTVG